MINLQKAINEGIRDGINKAFSCMARERSSAEELEKRSGEWDEHDREALLNLHTGPKSDGYRFCGISGEIVTRHNLSSWDDDGHVYCTDFGPLAIGYGPHSYWRWYGFHVQRSKNPFKSIVDARKSLSEQKAQS